jgi:Flp pilus assembly protein CpaB
VTTDLKGRVNQVWIAVGLICAIAAFGLAYYFTRTSAPPTAASVPSNGQLVVVARVAIPSGTLLTSGMLEETRLKGVLPTNAFASCQELLGEACASTVATGKAATAATTTASTEYAVVPITPNTVITANLVASSKVTQTPAFGNLSIPPGDVAMSIALTSLESVSGYLQVGDRIDFIATAANGNTNFAFEDIPVIAIGTPGVASSDSSTASGGNVVLEVTRSQALGIDELEKNGDIYNVVLRSSADDAHGYIPTTSTPANGYTAACTAGSKVNPIIQEDLQQAKQGVNAATKTYNEAQLSYNKDNTALQALNSSDPKQPAAKQLVLTDAATLAQDQFSLIEAQNEVTSDQAVLYCGASPAQSQSAASGYASGSPQTLQNLFGFNIG